MLEVAIKAAKKAGAFIKENYKNENLVSYKDPHNIVSEVDVEAESLILYTLQKAFPRHSFFSEEKGMIDNRSDYLWIIDPLDGTTNFTHHFPHFCVSIALTHKGEAMLGVIYQPMQNELFAAQKGKGSSLNGNHLTINNGVALEKTVLIINRGASKKEKLRHGDMVKLMSDYSRSIRVFGSTALDLCYVASGKFDVFMQNGCMAYDCAAGGLIAKEAGAFISDFSGNPWRIDMEKANDVLVAPPPLHKKLLAILKNAHA